MNFSRALRSLLPRRRRSLISAMNAACSELETRGGRVLLVIGILHTFESENEIRLEIKQTFPTIGKDTQRSA